MGFIGISDLTNLVGGYDYVTSLSLKLYKVEEAKMVNDHY